MARFTAPNTGRQTARRGGRGRDAKAREGGFKPGKKSSRRGRIKAIRMR